MFGIWAGKFTAWMLRRLGRKGTSLPGKVALALSPRLIGRLGAKLERCIVVTGTNGKTTTTSLLAGMLRADGPIMTNTEGANLQQGIAAVLLAHTTWLGQLKAKTALFEIDEATLPIVAKLLPIRVILVTNVFRDQLDRYGELDTTVDKIREGIEATDALVLLNGDDPLARHIGLSTLRRTLYFGMERSLLPDMTTQRDQMRDGAFCLRCGHELVYDAFIYGQLGYYRCPNCDFCRPHPDFSGRLDKSRLFVTQGTLSEVSFTLPVRGLFNIYNVLAAVACARVCGLNFNDILHGLQTFSAPLGRMQPFTTQPPTLLNLIKNPTGCDSVLQAICSDPSAKVLCIAINDLAADGRDVSWLWDADFEWITQSAHAVHCVVSGFRAEDMAVRMKYANYPLDKIHVEPDLSLALDLSLRLANEAGGLEVYVLTTYTLLYKAANGLKEREVAHDNQTTAHRASFS